MLLWNKSWNRDLLTQFVFRINFIRTSRRLYIVCLSSSVDITYTEIQLVGQGLQRVGGNWEGSSLWRATKHHVVKSLRNTEGGVAVVLWRITFPVCVVISSNLKWRLLINIHFGNCTWYYAPSMLQEAYIFSEAQSVRKWRGRFQLHCKYKFCPEYLHSFVKLP